MCCHQRLEKPNMLAISMSRTALGILLFVVCTSWYQLAAQDAPVKEVPTQEVTTEKVSVQPLMSNIQRVLQALDTLGHPLDAPTEQAVSAATKSRNAFELQRAIDRAVLAVVTLSPEQRVSVERGPAAAELQQAGYVPMLLKIINHSTSTPRLRIRSPQAGPVYAGVASFILQRQQQTQFAENQNTEHSLDRFLAAETYDRPPMTDKLSGLEVEYAIALLASSQAGCGGRNS